MLDWGSALTRRRAWGGHHAALKRLSQAGVVTLLRDIQIGSQTSWVELLVSLPLPAALSLPKC